MVCGTVRWRGGLGWWRLRTHSLLLIDAALPPCLPVVLLVIFFFYSWFWWEIFVSRFCYEIEIGKGNLICNGVWVVGVDRRSTRKFSVWMFLMGAVIWYGFDLAKLHFCDHFLIFKKCKYFRISQNFSILVKICSVWCKKGEIWVICYKICEISAKTSSNLKN